MENEKEAAELRLIYEQDVTEIRHLKGQQWRITYYAALVYAGFLAIHLAGGTLEPPPYTLRCILSVLAVVVAIVATLLIIDMQCALVAPRQRTLLIRGKFEKSVQDILRETETVQPIERYASPLYHWPIWAFMIAVTLIGALLVVVVLWP